MRPKPAALRSSTASRSARQRRARPPRAYAYSGTSCVKSCRVDFSLVRSAERGRRGLADDRHHRRVIHFCVIKTAEQMNRAGTRGLHAYSDFSRELGVRASHECGHFFVPDLEERQLVTNSVERTHDAVDAIAWVAVRCDRGTTLRGVRARNC